MLLVIAEIAGRVGLDLGGGCGSIDVTGHAGLGVVEECDWWVRMDVWSWTLVAGVNSGRSWACRTGRGRRKHEHSQFYNYDWYGWRPCL